MGDIECFMQLEVSGPRVNAKTHTFRGAVFECSAVVRFSNRTKFVSPSFRPQSYNGFQLKRVEFFDRPLFESPACDFDEIPTTRNRSTFIVAVYIVYECVINVNYTRTRVR